MCLIWKRNMKTILQIKSKKFTIFNCKFEPAAQILQVVESR